jgi:putative pyruvate formate lyase activating enzyme
MIEKIYLDLFYLRPDALRALEDNDVKRVLRRYVNIVKNEIPAKFLLLKSLEVEIPKDESLEELWKLHDSLMKEFKESEIQKTKFYETNLLTLKKLISKEIVKKC